MTWNFAEGNPFSESSGNWKKNIGWIAAVIEHGVSDIDGEAHQEDATIILDRSYRPMISSDPPYYDNIGYADLSDFFYIWLRRTLAEVYPEILGTIGTPKGDELVAALYRFGGDKRKARRFFEGGLAEAFLRFRKRTNPDYPVTIYYAFKQTESEKPSENGGVGEDDHGVLAVASTGWETMLTGLMEAGFRSPALGPCVPSGRLEA